MKLERSNDIHGEMLYSINECVAYTSTRKKMHTNINTWAEEGSKLATTNIWSEISLLAMDPAALQL